MDAEKILENLVRIGTVTIVNSKKGMAQVKFQDSSITSAWLTVLNASTWLPKVNDVVLTLYLPVFNGDGFILGRI